MFEDKEYADRQAAAVEKQIHEGGEMGNVDEKNIAVISENEHNKA